MKSTTGVITITAITTTFILYFDEIPEKASRRLDREQMPREGEEVELPLLKLSKEKKSFPLQNFKEILATFQKFKICIYSRHIVYGT